MTNVQSPFREAAQAELKTVGRYRDTAREVQMRADAADALAKLLAAAGAAGVGIIPISGFRTVAYQAGLFTRAIAKHGSEEKAAGWVARPGYSEHHTGLAVDLGADEFPASDVEVSFEETAAFRWLQEHAASLGFEMSYPRGNESGINYEPWHWRFIGTPAAREVFAA